jgi:5-methylcytosine-specific restriction enzyme subunit McrC
MIRGRVRFGDQLSRGGGLPLPVQVAYDDFTEDILENRMLLTASELLLRLPRIPPLARRLLQRARVVLDQVEPIQNWRGVKAPQTTRLNVAYEPALRLAELILSSASITASVGGIRDIRSTTFVFDMNRVFEDFVTNAFRSSMRRYGGVVRDQVKPYSLDDAGSLSLKPDLSWWVGGKCLAVLDAKYKAIEAGLIQHPDAYQMLAYCTAYGLPRGYLIYAKDSGAEARTNVIRNSGQQIIVATLDVEKEPEELLADVARLAADVVEHSRAPVMKAA